MRVSVKIPLESPFGKVGVKMRRGLGECRDSSLPGSGVSLKIPLESLFDKEGIRELEAGG